MILLKQHLLTTDGKFHLEALGTAEVQEALATLMMWSKATTAAAVAAVEKRLAEAKKTPEANMSPARSEELIGFMNDQIDNGKA